MSKKQVRANFRNEVFKRDNYTCQGCGRKVNSEVIEDEMDSHHITSRKDFVFGGYCKENGVTLCKTGKSPTCHEKAEAYFSENYEKIKGYSPEELYLKIGSSLEKAKLADEK